MECILGTTDGDAATDGDPGEDDKPKSPHKTGCTGGGTQRRAPEVEPVNQRTEAESGGRRSQTEQKVQAGRCLTKA